MAFFEPNWTQVVNDLGPSLYKYFQARCGLGLADDLTQECLLLLYRKHQSNDYDATRGNLRMFAYGIAKFLVLESLRKQSVNKSDSDDHLKNIAADATLDETIGTSQNQRMIRKAIETLSPIQQECLYLMMDDELSMDQIASVCGIPTNTVKSHIHRAKTELKEILSPLMEDL